MLTLSRLVTRYWYVVLLCWAVLAIGLRWLAPAWDDVTKDGDFQYLPADSPSVVGQEILVRSFPSLATQSHLVGIVARQEGDIQQVDVIVAYDLSRRLHLMTGIALLHQSGAQVGDTPQQIQDKRRLAESSLETFNRAIALTQELYQFDAQATDDNSTYFDDGPFDPLALALYNRSLAQRRLGNTQLADEDLSNARDIDPELTTLESGSYPPEFRALPITKIWSWQTEGIGPALMRLRGREALARLVVLHLNTEFLAVENTELFQVVRGQVDAVHEWSHRHPTQGLEIGLSGSAAVGSDLLLASVDSVRNTEWFTIILVTLILVVVYRAPLLVLVPLVTIGVSLDIALHGLALLTQFEFPGGGTLSLFKTTKIFIVVILFGAGTDFCLFLIARLRENYAEETNYASAVSKSLSQVSSALSASALTTILGLGTMYFAQFGKLSHSGPAIGLALAVTLVASLTLTPALLTAFGKTVFWSPRLPVFSNWLDRGSQASQRVWEWVGNIVVRYPGLILLASCGVLLIPAIHGQESMTNVTYDLLAGLDPQRPSRHGTQLLRQHFPIGESGPVIVMARLPEPAPPLDREQRVGQLQDQASLLATRLESIPGVDYVRSLQAPLGHRGKPSDPTQQVLRSLPFVQSLFVSIPEDSPPSDALQPWIARFDVVLKTDVFSLESTRTLNEILATLDDVKQQQTDSLWSDSEFSVAGTTAAIRDLRKVTRSDSRTIQILVVVVVFLVLVSILRHPIVCGYMILSVLASFLVTVGLTDWLFAWTYGENYQGLEWKVPLFLFVILVAVGEDYNVYLASRVFEEQKAHGPIKGLRIAIARTGGIITSCGMIMAGTFITMTSPVWYRVIPPQLSGLRDWLQPDGGSLQGMIQMGFALALGVLLDTFIVRPVLLPAYFALVVRWQSYLAMRRRLKSASRA